MADILTAQQIGDDPVFGTDGAPFLVSSPADLKALHKYLRPEFDKIVAKYNQKILYMVPSPAQYMFLKVKTDNVAGLKGIKTRGADKNTVDTCNAVGMAGVQIPWGELIPALIVREMPVQSSSSQTRQWFPWGSKIRSFGCRGNGP
jgi:TRAP-type C4-dicarboxylate transport system substrate-binding protein